MEKGISSITQSDLREMLIRSKVDMAYPGEKGIAILLRKLGVFYFDLVKAPSIKRHKDSKKLQAEYNEISAILFQACRQINGEN